MCGGWENEADGYKVTGADWAGKSRVTANMNNYPFFMDFPDTEIIEAVKTF